MSRTTKPRNSSDKDVSDAIIPARTTYSIVWRCIGWKMDQLEQKRQKRVSFGDFHAEQSVGFW
ncbi:hypothetical protein YC2023_109187 [Brassica napus]